VTFNSSREAFNRALSFKASVSAIEKFLGFPIALLLLHQISEDSDLCTAYTLRRERIEVQRIMPIIFNFLDLRRPDEL